MSEQRVSDESQCSILDSSLDSGPALATASPYRLSSSARSATAAMEAGLKQRTVLIEFESVDAAVAAYDSPNYRAALRLLGTGSVERDIRIVEAL